MPHGHHAPLESGFLLIASVVSKDVLLTTIDPETEEHNELSEVTIKSEIALGGSVKPVGTTS